MFDIKEELKKLPEKPGVYLMRDADDHIMYVGKAVNLKNRVRQYFQKTVNRGPQILRMIEQIAWFETIVVDSETEALILECNLIKEHKPKYNTLLMDDKAYPYICLTVQEDYPRVLLARRMRRDKCKYFGPYTNVTAVRDTLRLLQKIFAVRTCTRSLPADIGKERPCLNYQMKLCPAPCQGYISREEYRLRIDRVESFLKGQYRPVLKYLEEKMQAASDELDFEAAIRYRELLFSVKKMDERQKVSDTSGEDRDIVALAREGENAIAQIFFVREGKLIGRDHFRLSILEEESDETVLSDFLKQFYAGTPFLPKEILVPAMPEEQAVLQQWLGIKSGRKVSLTVPVKGEKHRLMQLARENASQILRRELEKAAGEEARTIGACAALAALLGLEKIIRMEAFDISNISGFQSVGSMVVYENGKPKKNDYRKFKIKFVQGANDYASMTEVIRRRFLHGLAEREKLRGQNSEEDLGRFSRFPDLILMDGGKGQVHMAQQVLATLGLSIPVCGMVKDDRHRTRGLYFNEEELPIDVRSEVFKLLTRIQDETHRFAIEYHRSLRGKEQVKSILDDIPGIGPVRRKALLRELKTMEALREADFQRLLAIPEMSRQAAACVYAFFHDGELPQA